MPPPCATVLTGTPGGIVIAAKTAEGLRVMNQKIRDRELKKYYLCIVHGTLPRPAGRLEGYILKDEAKNRSP